MRDEGDLKAAYLIYPQWAALFFVIGGVITLVVGVAAFFLGFSAASDVVFGIEALIGGIGAELVFRRALGRKLVVAPKVEIPFLYVWPLLCLYVMVARPFE